MTAAPPRSALDPRRSPAAPAGTPAGAAPPEARPRALRLVGLVEIALFFAAALALDWGLFEADRFREVQPHPFWLIVLVAALQYGTNEGLAAAAAATAALLVGNIPPPTIEQDIYDYYLSLSANPVMWMIAAVLIGEMRNRQITERTLLAARAAGAEWGRGWRCAPPARCAPHSPPTTPPARWKATAPPRSCAASPNW